MAIPENVYDLGFAFQTAQGAPAAASVFRLFMAGGDRVRPGGTNAPFEETSATRMRNERFAGERYVEGGPEFYVMPKSIGALLYAALGGKAVSGVADPWAHTLTAATSRPWLTFFGSVGAMIHERFGDCKIDQLVLSGSANMPIRAAVTVPGIDPRFLTAREGVAADAETTQRFVYYHGRGALKLADTAIASIREWTLTIANNGERIPGDAITPIDVSEGELAISLAITKLALTPAFYNEVWYGAASPSNLAEVAAAVHELGGPGVDFKLTRVAASPGPERSLRLQLPRMTVEPFAVSPGTGNSPLTEAISLEALQPVGASPITATVVNGVAAY